MPGYVWGAYDNDDKFDYIWFRGGDDQYALVVLGALDMARFTMFDSWLLLMDLQEY